MLIFKFFKTKNSVIFMSSDVTAFCHLLPLCFSSVILHVRRALICPRSLSTNSQAPLFLVLKYFCYIVFHVSCYETLSQCSLTDTIILKWWGFFSSEVKKNKVLFCPSKEKDRQVLVLRKSTIFQSESHFKQPHTVEINCHENGE